MDITVGKKDYCNFRFMLTLMYRPMSHFQLPERGVGIQNFQSTVFLDKDLDYQP